jgi:nitroimidazol reductase NimA-like FMN-containing flavoprotein (pyridoxamine 5'-phosphate oxidase superfamily)
MSIELTPEERWDFLARAHTGVLTTLDAAGYPVSLPTWHVVRDEHVYVRTRDTAAKTRHIARDDRVCFLVEKGERWVDLSAVALVGQARAVTDPELVAVVRRALAEKYGAYREARVALPDATRRHYATPEVIFEINGDHRVLSWDNQKIRRPA